MQPTNASLILQKLKELNAMLRNHIERAKTDVDKMEFTSHHQHSELSYLSAPKVSGAREVAQQWLQHLN